MSVKDDVKLRFDPQRAIRIASHFKHMLFLDRDSYDSKALERIVDFMIQKYPYDFTWTQSFEPEWFKEIMKVGFLPIASKYGGLVICLPKLHQHRCVMTPIYDSLLVHKSIRKKSRGYEISVDQDFEGVIRGCRKQHGMNWLYPEVVKSFRLMFRTRTDMDDLTIHSVELWDKNGYLVAGELGYVTCNSVYTSLTGFREGTGSTGTIQLCALGRHLASRGFVMWDLGMGMSYKTKMGANNITRANFVKSLRNARSRKKKSSFALPRTNARVVIDSCKSTSKSHKVKPSIDLSSLLDVTDESKLKHLSKNQLKKLKKMQLKNRYKKRRRSGDDEDEKSLDTPRTAAMVDATSDLFIAKAATDSGNNSTATGGS